MKTLDPGNAVNKQAIKASITDAISKELVGSNHDEIGRKVDAEYERLLVGAVIFAHIPSLTAGSVRREMREDGVRRRSRVAAAGRASGAPALPLPLTSANPKTIRVALRA